MSEINTKEFRHQVYKKALELYLIDIEKQMNLGICAVLNKAIYTLAKLNLNNYYSYDEINEVLPNYKDIDPYEKMEVWPEIIEHKPDDFSEDSMYWFPIMDTQVRINILEFAIEKTK